ncbi:MAG: hypothetical protein JNK76_23315 [Planctomycetales bacterium]|nr:hypothetical protein [Planctomycetales bacterium]
MIAFNMTLAEYLMDRLPEKYLLTPQDIAWLEKCSEYLSVPPTKRSVTEATKAAVGAHPRGHIDPFELLIDTKICDTAREPLRSMDDSRS